MSRRGHHGGTDRKRARELKRRLEHEQESRASRERRQKRQQDHLREVGVVD